MKSISRDQRGLSTGIMGFFAIIIIAALLYTLLDPGATNVFSMATEQASSTQAKEAIALREQIWSLMLYFMLFLAAIYMTARAVFESRGPV